MSIILAIVGFAGSSSKSKSSSEEIVTPSGNINVSTSYQHYCVPESYAKDEESKNHNPYIEFIEGKHSFLFDFISTDFISLKSHTFACLR